MRMRPLLLWISIASGLSFSVHAHSQDNFQQVEQASRDTPFEGRRPFGGLAELTYLNQTWSVSTFYTVYRGQSPRQTKFWVVRRVTGAPGEGQSVRWADSRSCGGVERVLIAMERMPAVRPDAPHLGEEAKNIGLVLDGTAHIFWNRFARSGPENATVDLEISGNVNSPIARWWAGSADDLAGCWQTATPE